MPIDLSKTSTPRDFGALMPNGTIAPLQVHIKPGGYGEGGLLTPAETAKGKSAYLHLEFIVTAGPHEGRKIWTRSTIEGDNHAAAIAITGDLLGSLARSAFNFSAKDEGAEVVAKLKDFDLRVLDGLRVIGKIGVERGKMDADTGERWPDKNTIVAGVTKDMKEWTWGPVVQDLNDNIAGAMASPTAPSSIDPPPWSE